MNPFYRLGSWMRDGLRRVVGIQYSHPSGYSEQSASPVTFDSAMQLSAVWACIKLLSETISSLPLTIYETSDKGRKVATNHPLNILFSGKVNRYQTKVEFFETVFLNLFVSGNSYCLIQRVGNRIVGLLPLMSADMEVTLNPDGSLKYTYTTDATVKNYKEKDIWHLKTIGNGIIGLSPLAYQRNTLGIAQAAEGAVTKIYKNGAKPSGVLSMDKFLNEEQRTMARQSFNGLTSGSDERLLVLEGGLKFEAISLSPQDIELLSSRQFQISEICRWYGVPSVMINDTSSTTVWGSGIEQIVSGFYKVTLRPVIEKVEQSIIVNLMELGDANKYEVEFSFDALLRSDIKTRNEAHRVAIYAGYKTVNEVRLEEGLPSVDYGDTLITQGANISLEAVVNGVNNNYQDRGNQNGNETNSPRSNRD